MIFAGAASLPSTPVPFSFGTTQTAPAPTAAPLPSVPPHKFDAINPAHCNFTRMNLKKMATF